MRILVVDRDEDRRDLTCVAVCVLGHRAEEAWDTRGALAALATEAFDVVIVDDQIPAVAEVTEFLLATTGPARRRAAVVVVSTDPDVRRRTALLRAGVVEVVTRPLSLAPLYGLLARIDRARL